MGGGGGMGERGRKIKQREGKILFVLLLSGTRVRPRLPENYGKT